MIATKTQCPANRPFKALHDICCRALAVVAVLVAALSPHWALAQSGLGIAAVVNDDVISMLDLDARMTMVLQSSQMPNTPETRARIAPQVLRVLIDEKLKQQETRRLNMKAPQEDVQTAIQNIAAGNKMTVEQLSRNMMNSGVPFTALTSQIETELNWQYYTGRRLRRSIQIGDTEIDDEIKRIQNSAGKPEMLLSEIYLPVDRPERDGEIRAVANRLFDQLTNGATSFKSLAQNFSASPSAAVDGDMGWVELSNLDPALQNTLQAAEPKTLFRPIRALGGYYILNVRDVRKSPGLGQGDATLKLSQFHVPVKNLDDSAAVRAAEQTVVTATNGMNSCAQLEAAGAKTGSMMSGSLGEVKLSTLSGELRAAVSSLRPGQVSPPVVTGGGVAVLMVCERTNEALDMDEVRTEIHNKILKERLALAAQKKLRDLRREAFVDIRL